VNAWVPLPPIDTRARWSHEHADMPPHAAGRYFEVTALDRLPDVIDALERHFRGELKLARIADALPQKAVEIK
jgi:hypothetical protein